MTNEENKLYAELKKLSDRANKRISSIERIYGKNSWGVKYLRDNLSTSRINALTKSGRISVKRSFTESELQAVINATNRFLNSSIGSVSGIKKAEKKAIETIQRRFAFSSDFSTQDAESLYNLFKDSEVNSITNYIKGSDVLPIIEQARESKMSYSDFYDLISGYAEYNKGSVEGNLLRKLYIKYVQNSDFSEYTENIENIYNTIFSMTAEATNQDDFDEIISIIEGLKASRDIDESDYNYLIEYVRGKM